MQFVPSRILVSTAGLAGLRRADGMPSGHAAPSREDFER